MNPIAGPERLVQKLVPGPVVGQPEGMKTMRHTITSTSTKRVRPARRTAWTAVAALAVGAILTACGSGSASSPTTAGSAAPAGTTATTATTGGADNALKAVEDRITRTTGATFSVSYQIAHGAAGPSESVTFAQSPPKSAVVTPTESFYINGSSVTACQGSGSSATCGSVPSSTSDAVDGFTDLFSPGVLAKSLRAIEAEAEAHTAGVSVTTSSGTYGGLASTCVTARSPSQPTPVTFCAADSSGILTYTNASGVTVTLTAYTPSPPASTFLPPAGATVVSVPAGT
jgi:hypothetical protein